MYLRPADLCSVMFVAFCCFVSYVSGYNVSFLSFRVLDVCAYAVAVCTICLFLVNRAVPFIFTCLSSHL